MSSRIIASFLFLALLAACGQKGPLYVPEEKPASASENGSASQPAGSDNGAGEDQKEDDEDADEEGDKDGGTS